MSNNRRRTAVPPKKGQGSSPQARNKSAGPTTKTAASQRSAVRQERRQEAALQARRTRNRRYALVSIGLVVVIVLALVLVKVSGGGGNAAAGDETSPPAGTPIPAATLSKLASVPLSTLAAAPTSGLINQIQPVSGGRPLTENGKPELLFIGAEYCPYCAAERWALYVALSKFGTFSPSPGRIHSATQDGNVPTLTFYGTTYSSPYFEFTPVEATTNKPSPSGGYTALQTPTAAQNALWQSVAGGSIPFLDFGGQEALVGAQYSYAPMSNLSFDDVAAQVGNNSTTIGANINAGAHRLIQTICSSLSSHQPASVCSSTSNG
jgi:hypothetical protein